MEKLRFDNGYELLLVPMGVGSTEEELEATCLPGGDLTAMERDVVTAAQGSAVLLSESGEALRTYRGYDRLAYIAKELGGQQPVVRLRLGKTSEVERRLDEIDHALVELAELVAGGEA